MHVRFRSLQQKLNAYALVLCISSLGALGVPTFYIARRQVQVDREQLMEVFAREISQQLLQELNESWLDLEASVRSESVSATLANSPRARIDLILPDQIRGRTRYELILVVDTAGRIRGAPPTVEGQDYSQLLPGLPQGWHSSILQSGRVQGIPWIRLEGPSRIHDSTSESSVEAKYHTVIGVPIAARNGGPSPGIILAVTNWARIQQILDLAQGRFRDIGLSTGYAFLVASDALTTIGHKYRELYGTDMLRDHHEPELYQRLRNNPTGTFRYQWREGWKIVAMEKLRPEILGPEFGWYLGVGINESDIFRPIEKLLTLFLVVSVVVALAMMLVTRMVGGRISVSLHEFAQLARDATRGRFSQLAPARTDDEIGELARAFNEMIVSFRAQIPFSQIPNHYVVGNPVRTAGMFFGRQDDLQWIGQQLARGGNKMIVLFGPRRIGKTSLLHQIASGHASARVLPFFFDTQQILPEALQDADFYHVLTREMLEQLPNVEPRLRAPFIGTERFTPETLRRLLKFLRDAEPGKLPILLFDELESLEYKFTRGVLSPDLLLFLASLLDGDTPVSFVATGSNQFDNLRSGHWGILIPKILPRRVGLFSRQDALRLITEPVRGYVLYDPAVPESILRITAGHPYYTQVICQALVDYLNLKREFAFDLQSLSYVVEDVLNNPPPPLSHVWDNFSSAEKLAVSALAQALPDNDVFLSPAEILAALPSDLRSDVVDPAVLRTCLNQLTRDDWVEADRDSYRFRIDLFRLWLLREHSVWQVADELQRSSP
jgi:HAMP domain-containing protein